MASGRRWSIPKRDRGPRRPSLLGIVVMVVFSVFVMAAGLFSAFYPPPRFENLTVTSGTVVDTHISSGHNQLGNHDVLSFHIAETGQQYEYQRRWSPHFDRIVAAVTPGSTVTMWYYQHGDTRQVWQLERQGEMVLPYQDAYFDARHGRWVPLGFAAFVTIAVAVRTWQSIRAYRAGHASSDEQRGRRADEHLPPSHRLSHR